MRTITVLLCGYALLACASNKSAEPPIENPNEVHDPMSAESVRENGAPSPDSDLDGHRDDAERADGKRADRVRDRDLDDDKVKDEVEDKNEPVAADNTGRNERDEEPGALTPADQGEGDSDLEITQNIRKAVMDDDSLSFTAKNVKIITQDGKVTLRGPVKSAQERSAIGVAAKKFAAGRVDNQLEVANLRRTIMGKAVMGIVETRQEAEAILGDLQSAGIPNNDISILFPDKTGTKDFAHEHNTKAPEGAVAGIGTGGVIGGTLGLLAGIGALAIPGFGPLIAAGPIMAALSGAAAGAAVGGVAGALIGMGIPEIEAKHYEGKIRGGNILVAVHTESAEARKTAVEVLKRGGAHDVTSLSEASVPKEKNRDDRAEIERKDRERLEAESAERERQERERIQRESGTFPPR